MAELTDAFGEGQIPTHDQVKTLPYLQATITEGYAEYSRLTSRFMLIIPVGFDTMERTRLAFLVWHPWEASSY